MTFYAWRSKDSDAAGSNFMAAQLLGNASLQVDLHVSFGRCFRRFGNGEWLGSTTTIVKNTKVSETHQDDSNHVYFGNPSESESLQIIHINPN
jgi:hypothetical protein